MNPDSPARHLLLQNRIARASAPFRSRPSLYYYARGKMRHDPAYPLLARLLYHTTHPILDLGCGAGLFAAYLREAGLTAPITGVDLSAPKIALAQKQVASRYQAIEFLTEDAAAFLNRYSSDSPPRRTLIALDILHYFTPSSQISLLQKMAALTPPGGSIYLRNGLREPTWRYWMTLVEEAWVRQSRWIRGEACHFPSRASVETTLRQNGLRVVTVPLWGQTPFSSHLFVATRPAILSP